MNDRSFEDHAKIFVEIKALFFNMREQAGVGGFGNNIRARQALFLLTTNNI
jgi:ribosomal protein L29